MILFSKEYKYAVGTQLAPDYLLIVVLFQFSWRKGFKDSGGQGAEGF